MPPSEASLAEHHTASACTVRSATYYAARQMTSAAQMASCRPDCRIGGAALRNATCAQLGGKVLLRIFHPRARPQPMKRLDRDHSRCCPPTRALMTVLRLFQGLEEVCTLLLAHVVCRHTCIVLICPSAGPSQLPTRRSRPVQRPPMERHGLACQAIEEPNAAPLPAQAQRDTHHSGHF